MWSLFKKKEGEVDSDDKAFQPVLPQGIFDFSGEKLDPLRFSNGKTQADVVAEILKAIEKGNKIIFVRGVCGTGKSAIALNLARHFKKTSIVVPIKSLQEQYEEDYARKKYILRQDNKKLKISVIKGRNNFRCPFLGERADDELLPCTIELRDKNMNEIKKFIELNKGVSKYDFQNISDVRRMSVAPACPYWSPILPADMTTKSLDGANKKRYETISGKDYAWYQRKRGCGYYDQYEAYIDSDVLIFNSQKYLLEGVMGRKPKTDIDIIDECDEFLDKFALEGTINLTRLKNELGNCICAEDSEKKLVESLSDDLADISRESLEHLGEKDNVTALKSSKVAELIKGLVKSDLFEIMSDESYLEHCIEVARKFIDVIDDAYINFYRDENKKEIYAKLVTINLDKLINSLIDKNKAFVFMSGTLHSEKVLREIFGLKNFKTIDAETFNQGTIKKLKTGLEKDFKFENFKRNLVTREQYLRALDRCIDIAKIPIVVQVSAFQDLPSDAEKDSFNIKNLISSNELMEQQTADREGRLVNDFKSGKTKILFTTRCSRGIDFPFETCNSVVITKFPYPNTQSLFWKILSKNKPDIYWDFYRDKAHRELLQKVYRSVRSPLDHVFLLSPDIRVLNSNIV